MTSEQTIDRGRHWDAIVVGGRPSGSTLAARLGQQGLRVLLLERAAMPSPPAVSCPVIYSSTMRLLDEIGVDEAEYARGTPRIRRWITEVRGDYATSNAIPDLFGRDYAYAIDRARFDDALWRHARSFASVEALDHFAVSDLVWDGQRVIGIKGRHAGGTEEIYTADCVVGADGRFSLVARKAGARVYDEQESHPTSILYAYWKNVAPFDEHGPAVHVFGPGLGYGFLIMESADGMTCVAIEGQAALLDHGDGKPRDLYDRLVREHGPIWRRLQQAERATGVHGMRNIGNLYRQAGGAGWALVGDALHQKDPLDGQGMFDAVFTARALALAIGSWKRGEQTWDTALAAYDAAVRAETYPMYLRTLERVRNEVYGKAPEWAYNTTLRWILEDKEYKRRIALLVTRGISPTNWLPRRVALAALARGAFGTAGRWIGRRLRIERQARSAAGGS